MPSFKQITKFACQIVAGMYAASLANRFVGEAFDRIFGSKNKR
jgi:hypothetical protein